MRNFGFRSAEHAVVAAPADAISLSEADYSKVGEEGNRDSPSLSLHFSYLSGPPREWEIIPGNRNSSHSTEKFIFQQLLTLSGASFYSPT